MKATGSPRVLRFLRPRQKRAVRSRAWRKATLNNKAARVWDRLPPAGHRASACTPRTGRDDGPEGKCVRCRPCGLGESEDPRVAPKRSRHVDAKRKTKVRVIAEGGEGRSGSGKSNHRVPHFFFRGPTSAVGDASAKAKRPSPREEERTNDDRKWPSEQAAAPDWVPPRSRWTVPPVYPWAVSRSLELSLQSSFQLSLTVLVDYRTRPGI